MFVFVCTGCGARLPLTDLLLRPKVRRWDPSSRGTDLIDPELDGELGTPVPGHAWPDWERWLAGARRLLRRLPGRPRGPSARHLRFPLARDAAARDLPDSGDHGRLSAGRDACLEFDGLGS